MDQPLSLDVSNPAVHRHRHSGGGSGSSRGPSLPQSRSHSQTTTPRGGGTNRSSQGVSPASMLYQQQQQQQQLSARSSHNRPAAYSSSSTSHPLAPTIFTHTLQSQSLHQQQPTVSSGGVSSRSPRPRGVAHEDDRHHDHPDDEGSLEGHSVEGEEGDHDLSQEGTLSGDEVDASTLSSDEETALLRQMQVAQFSQSLRPLVAGQRFNSQQQSQQQPSQHHGRSHSNQPSHHLPITSGQPIPSSHQQQPPPQSSRRSASAAPAPLTSASSQSLNTTSNTLTAQQPFTLAEVDILTRLDSLRMGLESYRSHTTSSIREVRQETTLLKQSLLSSLSQHLFQLEGKIHALQQEKDTSMRDQLTTQLDKLKNDILVLRKKDCNKLDQMEARVNLHDETVEELKSSMNQLTSQQTLKLQQLKNDFNQRLQQLEVTPRSTNENLNASFSQTFAQATSGSPLSSSSLTNITPQQLHQLTSELVSMKDQQTILLQRLDFLEQQSRQQEQSNSNQARLKQSQQQQAMESMKEQFETRVSMLENTFRMELQQHSQQQHQEFQDESRKKEFHLAQAHEKQVEALRKEMEEERRTQEVTNKQQEKELFQLRTQFTRHLKTYQTDQTDGKKLLLASPVTLKTQQSPSATPRKSTMMGTAVITSQPSVTTDARLDQEIRKRRELLLKVHGYENIQKQLMDDVIALTKQQTVMKKEVKKLAANHKISQPIQMTHPSYPSHAITGQTDSIVLQLQKDMIIQNSNVKAQHDAIKELYKDLAQIQSQLTSSSPSSSPKKSLKIMPVSTAADDEGKSGAVEPPSSTIAPPPSTTFPSAAQSQTQAQLIRSQKKLLMRYKTLTTTLEALTKTTDESKDLQDQSRKEIDFLRKTTAAQLESASEELRDLRKEVHVLKLKVPNVSRDDKSVPSVNITDFSLLQGEVNTVQQRLQEFLLKYQADRSTQTKQFDSVHETLQEYEQRLKEQQQANQKLSQQFDTKLKEYDTKLKTVTHDLVARDLNQLSDGDSLQKLTQQVNAVVTAQNTLENKLQTSTLESNAALTRLTTTLDGKISSATMALDMKQQQQTHETNQVIATIQTVITKQAQEVNQAIATLQAALTPLQQNGIDPVDWNANQTMLKDLSLCVKTQSSLVTELRSALNTLETKHQSLQVENNNQESFNYDLSTQLTKSSGLLKALEARALFLESKVGMNEKKIQEEKKHLDESLTTMTASLQTQTLAVQKTQERLVSLLDGMNEIEHSITLQQSSHKKSDMKINSLEQQLQSVLETLHSTVINAGAANGGSITNLKENSAVNTSTLNSLLARLQALESESELLRSHSLRLDSIDTNISNLTKSNSTTTANATTLDLKCKSLSQEILYLIDQKLPEQRESLEHLQSRMEELYKRSNDSLDEVKRDWNKKVHTLEKTTEKFEKDLTSVFGQNKRVSELHTALATDVESIHHQLDKVARIQKDQAENQKKLEDGLNESSADLNASTSKSSGISTTITPATEAFIHSKIDALAGRVHAVEQQLDQNQTMSAKTLEQQTTILDSCQSSCNEHRTQLNTLSTSVKVIQESIFDMLSRKDLQTLQDQLTTVKERYERLQTEMKVTSSEVISLRSTSLEMNEVIEGLQHGLNRGEFSSSSIGAPTPLSPTSQKLLQTEVHQLSTSFEHLKRKVDHLADEAHQVEQQLNKRMDTVIESVESKPPAPIAPYPIPASPELEEKLARVSEETLALSKELSALRVELARLASTQLPRSELDAIEKKLSELESGQALKLALATTAAAMAASSTPATSSSASSSATTRARPPSPAASQLTATLAAQQVEQSALESRILEEEKAQKAEQEAQAAAAAAAEQARLQEAEKQREAELAKKEKEAELAKREEELRLAREESEKKRVEAEQQLLKLKEDQKKAEEDAKIAGAAAEAERLAQEKRDAEEEKARKKKLEIEAAKAKAKKDEEERKAKEAAEAEEAEAQRKAAATAAATTAPPPKKSKMADFGFSTDEEISSGESEPNSPVSKSATSKSSSFTTATTVPKVVIHTLLDASSASTAAASPSPSPSPTAAEAFSPINKPAFIESGAATASTQVPSNVIGSPNPAVTTATTKLASSSSFSAAAAPAPVGEIIPSLNPNGLYSIDLTISLRNLPRITSAARERKPNPLCILYERPSTVASSKFIFMSKTEWQENESDPIFFRHFEGKYRNSTEELQRVLLFRIYDVNEKPSQEGKAVIGANMEYEVHESDRLGDVIVPVSEIIRTVAISSQGGSQMISFPLRHTQENSTTPRPGITTAQIQKLNERVARSMLLLEATIRPIDETKMKVETNATLAWSSILSPSALAGSTTSSPSPSPPPLKSSLSSSSLTQVRVASIPGLDDNSTAALIAGATYLKYPSGSFGGLLSAPAETAVFCELVDPAASATSTVSGSPAASPMKSSTAPARVSGLYWCKPGQRSFDSSRFIAFTDIVSVVSGNTAKAFNKFIGKPQKVINGQTYRAGSDTCFSIQGKTRNLELEARTQTQRDLMVKALTILQGAPNSIQWKNEKDVTPSSTTRTLAKSNSSLALANAAKMKEFTTNFDALFEESTLLPAEESAASSKTATAPSSASVTVAASAAPVPSPVKTSPNPTSPTKSGLVNSSAPQFPPLSSPTARRMVIRCSCRSLPTPGATKSRILVLEEADADFEFRAVSVTELVASSIESPSFTKLVGFELKSFAKKSDEQQQLIQFSLYDFPNDADLPSGGLDLNNVSAACAYFNSLSSAKRVQYRLGTVLAESEDLVAGGVDAVKADPKVQQTPLVYEIQEHDDDDEDEDEEEEVKPVRVQKLFKPAHLILHCTLLPPGVSGNPETSNPTASPSSPSPSSPSSEFDAHENRSPTGFEVREFYSPEATKPNTSASPSSSASPTSSKPSSSKQSILMWLSCSNLPKMNSFKSNNIRLVLYEEGKSSSGAAVTTERAQTLMIPGLASPSFKDPLQFTAHAPFNHTYKVVIHDVPTGSTATLNPNNIIGEIRFTLASVLGPAAASPSAKPNEVTLDITSSNLTYQSKLQSSHSKLTLRTKISDGTPVAASESSSSTAKAADVAPKTPVKSSTSSVPTPHRSPVTGRVVYQPDGALLTPAQQKRHDAFAVSASKAERQIASAGPATVLARDRGVKSLQTYALYIRLRNLPVPPMSQMNAAIGGMKRTQAPIAALFVQSADGTFGYSSQTEWSSGADPDFHTPLELQLHPDQNGELLKINVYDCQSATVTDAERVGSVLVRFSDVIHSTNELAFALAHENQDQNSKLAAGNVLLILKCEPLSLGGNKLPSGASANAADEHTATGGGLGTADTSFSTLGTSIGLGEDSLLDLSGGPASTKSARHGGSTAVSPTSQAAPGSKPSSSAATATLSAPGFPPGTGKEVCISISCRDLPVTKPGATTVDPIAAAFMQDPRTKHFIFASQTEWLHNTRNPDFDNLTTLDHHQGKDQIVKFSVYDVSSAQVRDNECIGSVLVRLDDIIGSDGELMYQLLHEDPVKAARIKGAVIILTHELDEDELSGAEDDFIHESDVSAPTPHKSHAHHHQQPPPSSTGALRTPARGSAAGRLSMTPGEMSSSEEED